jgi:hypothetical protein
MKKLSSISLYILSCALVLASGILLAHPPVTAFASACTASCQYGSNVSVSGSSCSCTDNVGCTFTENGHSYTQSCAKRGDDFLLEESAN